MTRAERICLWVYAIMMGVCVVFFGPIERSLLGSGLGEAKEVLAVIFAIVGAIMIFATGGKKHLGASIALVIVNAMLAAMVFYAAAWIFTNVLS